MIQCFSLTTKQHEPAFKSEKSSAEQGWGVTWQVRMRLHDSRVSLLAFGILICIRSFHRGWGVTNSWRHHPDSWRRLWRGEAWRTPDGDALTPWSWWPVPSGLCLAAPASTVVVCSLMGLLIFLEVSFFCYLITLYCNPISQYFHMAWSILSRPSKQTKHITPYHS